MHEIKKNVILSKIGQRQNMGRFTNLLTNFFLFTLLQIKKKQTKESPNYMIGISCSTRSIIWSCNKMYAL